MSSHEQPSQVPITEPITVSFTTLHPTQTPSPMPHDSPLLGGHTPGSDEGSKKLNELTELCTKLSNKVTSLEDDLKQTKKLYGKALTKLVKKVKQLETKLKSTIERRKAMMVIFDDEDDLVSEDTSKQGRMTETKYEEQLTPIKVTQGKKQCQESSEAQLSVLSTAKILVDASRERVKTYTRRRSTDSSRDSTVGGLFSTAEEVQAREEQEMIDFKKALELQKQLDEREETYNIDWNIVAKQVQERQSDTIKRYQTLKKKPVSVAQARKNMMIYLKNMVGYKMGYFKGMSYDEIRPIFKEEYNKIQTLFKKDTEFEKTKTKRIAEETLLQESFKKLRTAEASRSEPIQEQPTEEPKELSEEKIKKMLEIVPVEEIKAEALQVKYPIIDWEIHTEGLRKYWKIIRVRNITKAYQVFEDMLKGFDREDLVTLWSLVKERFRSAEPTEDNERALWVKLKRLFEPDKDNVMWKLQRYMYDPLTWRLYDTCGEHHVSLTRGHDIYMLIEKDYALSTAVMNLMLCRRLQVEEDTNQRSVKKGSISSHHFGTNVAEAEVDSLIRSSTLVMKIITISTPMVDTVAAAKEKPIEPLLFGVASSSAGGTDPTPGGFSDLTGSDFIVGGIRTVISPDTDLQKFSASIRRMEHDQLFKEFNARDARQMSLNVEVRMRAEYNIREKRRLKSVVEDRVELLKVREKEVEDLKVQLLLKEAEAAEAIRLRAEASKFEAVEKSLQDEVKALKERNASLEKERDALDVNVTGLEASAMGKDHELTNLNAQLTSVKSYNDSLVDQVHELEVSSSKIQEKLSNYENLTEQLEEFQDAQLKIINDKFDKLYADFVEMALHLEEKFYPHLLTTISGRRWLLTHGMKLAIIKCLNSPEYLSALRAAIGKAIEKGMQDGLADGITHGKEGRELTDVAAHNPSTEVDYVSALQQLQDVYFSLLADLKSNKDASVET
ncbi:hypothetical protein Tco_1278713, partial [Tanacetum coccineum]